MDEFEPVVENYEEMFDLMDIGIEGIDEIDDVGQSTIEPLTSPT